VNSESMLRFDGLVALVTGAGRGLGREHARLLAARGAAVVVNDRPITGDAAVLADEIVASGGRAVAYEGDVAVPGAAAAAVESALVAFGRLDAVIANAGVLRSAELADTDDELLDEVLGVNLRGAFATARAAWPSMMAQGSGRVVFTTSNSGLLGVPGSSAYGASKAALWGLTRVLGLEGAEHGIGVNAIAPIAFTAMSAASRAAPESWRTGEGDEWAARLAPEQIAPVVGWLAHPDCTLNGEVLSVAGGRVARFFLGLTPGVVDDALTVESVRAHEAEILREDGYEVLVRAAQEATHLHRRVMR
jgi:NAD(P)-dependent dehydrogenase (short-subunit alcohol dehydrogenase family)